MQKQTLKKLCEHAKKLGLSVDHCYSDEYSSIMIAVKEKDNDKRVKEVAHFAANTKHDNVGMSFWIGHDKFTLELTAKKFLNLDRHDIDSLVNCVQAHDEAIDVLKNQTEDMKMSGARMIESWLNLLPNFKRNRSR